MTAAQAMMPRGMAFISPPTFATKGNLQSPSFSGGLLATQKKHCAILPVFSPAQASMSLRALPASHGVPLSASGHEVLPDAEPLVSSGYIPSFDMYLLRSKPPDI